MWILKSANNENCCINVSFHPTYNKAYDQMVKEAESSMLYSTQEMNIDSYDASVYNPNGDLYYWSVEEVKIPEQESDQEEICHYYFKNSDVKEAMLFHVIEFSIDGQYENDRLYNFVSKIFNKNGVK